MKSHLISRGNRSMPDLVDIIFLDIDGVLLPFGGTRDNYHNDNPCTNACLFPDCTMDALTTLLHRIKNTSLDTNSRGNPVLLLSSTWRARSEFIQDILSSFRAYAGTKGLEDASALQTWESHFDSFFDICDPTFHATRHDEIYKWVRTNVAAKREDEQIVIEQYSNGTSAMKKFIVRSWIALDDEDLVNVEGRVEQDTRKHAVQTKSSMGLTLQDVDLGVQLLERQMHEFHDVSS